MGNPRDILFIEQTYESMRPKRHGHFIKPDYDRAYDLAYAYEADVLAAAGSISTYCKRRLS